MGLRVRDRARYARQLLLPQIGEVGQARLLAAVLRAPGDADPGTLAVACSYLERAGVRVATADHEVAHADVRVTDTLCLPAEDELARIAGRVELLEAARALAGALSAVQAIARILRPGESPRPAFSIPVLSSEEL
jgi:hypothetical protein